MERFNTMVEQRHGQPGRLAGRVAIVTGAGQGLGRAYAVRLAQEGAHVLVADIDAASCEKVATSIVSDGGNALASHSDVTNAESVKQMVNRAASHLGGIDILVNNAGGSLYSRRPFEEFDEASWDHVMNVNLKGAWLCARACAGPMKKAGWGRIINISTTSVFRGEPQGLTPYITAKAGIVTLTRAVARELGPFNVTVNAIAPGWTPAPAPKQHQTAELMETMRQRFLKELALTRIETPDDLANAVVFLASEEASFITGQLINVDGGGSLH